MSGEASPDAFFVDKSQGVITRRLIGRKREKLINLPGGGTQLVDVPEAENSQASLSDEQVLTLARYGMKLEAYFQSPQDIEWALDQQGPLFILQSPAPGSDPVQIGNRPGRHRSREHPLLLSQGQTASPGVAVGTVCPAAGLDPAHLPENPILVARTASPDYAGLMGRIKGLITDIGSVTSHLASVAREFGVPTIVDTGNATAVLSAGQESPWWPTRPGLSGSCSRDWPSRPARPARPSSTARCIIACAPSWISFLPLTSPIPRPSISGPPAAGRSMTSSVLSHEKAMQEMFGLAEKGKSSGNAVRLTANLPLLLYLIDLGGGLRSGLTTCDTVTPDDLESLPMKALWRGFSHPGITWNGKINVDVKNFMALMAQGVMTGPDAMPGGDSYAILSRDYVNINAKFGYHFANLDAFDGDTPDQNYIHLQFAGGVGTFVGRSLRLTFLGEVLVRLGFSLKVTGDLFEASVSGLDRPAMDQTLDQVGRLLASSRLLDMAINSEADLERMVAAFFQGDYDFLNQSESRRLPNFYTSSGNWRSQAEDGRTVLWQDGSHTSAAFPPVSPA